MNVVELEILGEKHIPELQELLMRCSDYLAFQDGEPVKKDAAKDLLISRPDNVTIQDKIVYGIYQGQDHLLIGVVDIIMRFAGPDILSLVLLVIEPTFRGKGLGEVVHKLLEEWAHSNKFSRIRLGVLFDNEKGHRFWKRVGYEETGEIKPYLAHKFRVLEKAI
ncbi:acetyltransferase [Desulfosporosinus orientis DSM 765]|uniref:Acetyltransferase n=1 Tax=Desulfosporosinus orientis (strain ATCC 19365 / DSM 765 / NCIMB 8382 / VKM B-1628 / Singapore I) TaxID=768706 RepID=G7WBG6_DESOD|nr:acetyltransferase [Desulfosporosinus orientis DSM 765]